MKSDVLTRFPGNLYPQDAVGLLNQALHQRVPFSRCECISTGFDTAQGGQFVVLEIAPPGEGDTACVSGTYTVFQTGKVLKGDWGPLAGE